MKQEMRCTIVDNETVSGIPPIVSSATLDALAEAVGVAPKVPKNSQTRWLEISYIEGTDREQAVMDAFAKHGVRPRFTRHPYIGDIKDRDPMMVQMQGTRRFEAADLKKAELFTFSSQQVIAKVPSKFDRKGGILKVRPSSVNPRVRIGSLPMGATMICTTETRSLMEAEGFKGLTFRPVLYPDGSAPEPPLYELWSDIRLPRKANRHVNARGEPWDGKTHEVVWSDELCYTTPLDQYRRSDLAKVGDFDVGVAAEPRTGYFEGWYAADLICSRQFRQWCLKQKLKLNWAPVQVID